MILEIHRCLRQLFFACIQYEKTLYNYRRILHAGYTQLYVRVRPGSYSRLDSWSEFAQRISAARTSPRELIRCRNIASAKTQLLKTRMRMDAGGSAIDPQVGLAVAGVATGYCTFVVRARTQLPVAARRRGWRTPSAPAPQTCSAPVPVHATDINSMSTTRMAMVTTMDMGPRSQQLLAVGPLKRITVRSVSLATKFQPIVRPNTFD